MLLLLALAAGNARAGAPDSPQPPRASESRDPLAALARRVQAHPDALGYFALATAVGREIFPALDDKRAAAAERQLEALASKLKEKLKGYQSGEEAVRRVNALVYQELGVKTATDLKAEKEKAEYYFPHAVLERKEGVCLGECLLYLALCERAGLPVVPIHAPQHIYLRFDDGKEKVNLEATDGGRIFDERALIERSQLAPEALARKTYYQPIGKLGVLADLLNAAAWCSAIGTAPRPLSGERAVLAAELCVELGPDNYNNWDTLAQAHYYAGQPAQALESLRKAIAMRPPVVGQYNEHYWSERRERFSAAAERAAQAAAGEAKP